MRTLSLLLLALFPSIAFAAEFAPYPLTPFGSWGQAVTDYTAANECIRLAQERGVDARACLSLFSPPQPQPQFQQCQTERQGNQWITNCFPLPSQ
jgi:hypothetical protein